MRRKSYPGSPFLAALAALACSADPRAGDAPSDSAGDPAATGGSATGGQVPSGGAAEGGGQVAASGGAASAGGAGGQVGGGAVVTHPTCPGLAADAYLGVARLVPGTIEAEHFDPGGYFDATPGNEGGALRADVDVDIKELSDGHAIGWMTAGEWLEYTVDVPVAGEYLVTFEVGAVEPSRTLELSSCGAALVEPVAVPTVAAWGELATAVVGPVTLAAGVQVLRVTVGDADYVDFGAMTFAPSDGGGTGGGGTGGAPATCPETYTNPLIWEDLPDLEVIRVGDAFYYTASTFHHSPGAPLLRSYDLVNWEYVGHSVPRLDWVGIVLGAYVQRPVV